VLKGEKIDVVKLDIEGGELAALEGMPRLLAAVSTMFFECAPEVLLKMGTTAAAVRGEIEKRGFTIAQLDPLNLLCTR
jgi:hypothetical protein